MCLCFHPLNHLKKEQSSFNKKSSKTLRNVFKKDQNPMMKIEPIFHLLIILSQLPPLLELASHILSKQLKLISKNHPSHFYLFNLANECALPYFWMHAFFAQEFLILPNLLAPLLRSLLNEQNLFYFSLEIILKVDIFCHHELYENPIKSNHLPNILPIDPYLWKDQNLLIITNQIYNELFQDIS